MSNSLDNTYKNFYDMQQSFSEFHKIIDCIRNKKKHEYKQKLIDDQKTVKKVNSNSWDKLFEDNFLSNFRKNINIGLSSLDINNIEKKYIETDLINDQEIIDIVLEEVQELLPKIDILLSKYISGDNNVSDELHRLIHTLKGCVGQIGAKKTRELIHNMESIMEKASAGTLISEEKQNNLLYTFSESKKYIDPILRGEYSDNKSTFIPETTNIPLPKTIRVKTQSIDSMINKINECYLRGSSLKNNILLEKQRLNELEFNIRRIFKIFQEFEIQTEMQMQSNSALNSSNNNSEYFDPLELDRFTRLQELSRLAEEGLSDIIEIKNELNNSIEKQENQILQQNNLVQQVKDNLHSSRLVPIMYINERLKNSVSDTCKEENKKVNFKLSGKSIELDRVLLEKIIPPLDHILRNSIVHGIESKEKRKKLKKKITGSLDVIFKQEAGYIFINVKDDGMGLNIEKIKEKAVALGLWEKDKNITTSDAIKMICAPGFSTVDKVSQRAGRGVGMDVVKDKIKELGGEFNIESEFNRGLNISIKLPSSLILTSVLIVEDSEEQWAVPSELIENVFLFKKSKFDHIKTNDFIKNVDSKINGSTYISLYDWINSNSNKDKKNDIDKKDKNVSVILLKEKNKKIVLRVNKLDQVYEVPLKKIGSIYKNIKGLSGCVILPDGTSAFLINPFDFNNNNYSTINKPKIKSLNKDVKKKKILIVDDSLSVRKITSNFLNKSGYEVDVAKNGMDALEKLNTFIPSLILLDLEMPIMDGFECLKRLKSSNNFKNIPVVIITSRSAIKHKNKALELGAYEYMAKPFKNEKLLNSIKNNIK